MRIDGTYSLLDPEYTWMVPVDEQQANLDPFGDHERVLMAPAEENTTFKKKKAWLSLKFVLG